MWPTSWIACRVGLTGVGRILTCFPQFLVQARSCPAVHHRVHYLVQEVLRAPQGLQTFRLSVPMLSHANGLLQVVFPVVFDYREHDLRCDSSVSAIMLSLVVSRLVLSHSGTVAHQVVWSHWNARASCRQT